MSARTAGLLVKLDHLWFLPAEIARKVVRPPKVSDVPGVPLGIALVDGRVVSVIRVSSNNGDLVLCDVNGETVALSGFEVVASGAFTASADGVVHEGREIRTFDVSATLDARRASTFPPPASSSP